MPHLSSDRNLLFGILALQMDFVTRDVLIEGMNAWAVDKSKTLGQILGDRQALQADERQLLEALVGKHLERHGSDPARSLAALSHGGAAQWAIGEIGSSELLAALIVPETAAPSGDNPLETRSPAADPPPLLGTRFRILRPHARGGLGEVYIALDGELNREVALKEIQDRHADHPESRARFVQEAEITGGLEHPGIVPVYGLGHYDDGRPYYAMRFIRGDSLDDAITRFHQAERPGRDPGERELGVRTLLGRFVDVCDAIAYAHSRGVLHRDIKPGNVMLGRYGETMVVDWGLAKPLGHVEPGTPTEEVPLVPSQSGTAETGAGRAVGTPQYMSPEQASGRLDQLGPRSDVYSLGATLYTVLTGNAPFGKSTVGEVLRKVERGDFPPPRQVNPKVAPGLQAICLKAMSLRPDDRYQTPRAMAEDVERWLADEPVAAHREGRLTRSARWLRRNRTYAQAGALALIAVTVVATASALIVARSLHAESRSKSEAQENLRRALENRTLASDTVDELTTLSQVPLLNDRGTTAILEGRPLREALLQAALRYNRKLLEQKAGDDEMQAEAHFRVGQIIRQIGSKSEALEAYRKALAIRVALQQARPGDPSRRGDLAECLIALGILLAEVERLDEAVEMLDQSLVIREQASVEQPDNPQVLSDLAEVLYWAGDTLALRGANARARHHLERSLTIRDRLAAGPDPGLGPKLELARCQIRIGRWHQNDADTKGARDAFARAVALLNRLVADHPRDHRVLAELARGQHELARETWEIRRDDAMGSLEAALAIRVRLLDDHPTVTEFHRELAANHFMIAVFHELAGRADQAIAAYGRSRAIIEPLVAANPKVLEWRSMLAQTFMRVGLVEQSRGRVEVALAACSRAMEILSPFVDRGSRDVKSLAILATLLNNLGAIQAETGQFAEAVRSIDQGVEIIEALIEERPTIDRRQQRTSLLINLGVFQAKLGQTAEASRSIERARSSLRASDDPLDAFLSACVEAQLAREPKPESKAHADRAVAELHRALAGGFSEFDAIRTEIGLKPLADRADFREILLDLGFPERPFAQESR